MFHAKNKGQAGNKYSESEQQAVKVAGYSETLANAEVLTSDIDEKTGLLLVEDNTNDNGGVVSLHNNGGTATPTKQAGAAAITIAKDTASSVNVYVEDGVVKVQNLTGGAIDLTLKGYL